MRLFFLTSLRRKSPPVQAFFCATLLATVLLFTTRSATADALDTRFGHEQGWVTTGFHRVPSYDQGLAILQQADGKLLVVASTKDHQQNKQQTYLLRFNTDDTPDTAFGDDGILVLNNGLVASSTIQQRDGKLVQAGFEGQLTRFDTNGLPDNDFYRNIQASVGKINANSYYSGKTTVIEQSNGKLLVAWSKDSKGLFLTRYNTDGTLDATFNGGSKLSATGYTANNILQQQDGKLVVAANSISNDFTLLRYNQDGTVDTTFNGTGIVTVQSLQSRSMALKIVQQADGKLLATGETEARSFPAVRFNLDGTLDKTFNQTGIASAKMSQYGGQACHALLLQADSRLVLVGKIPDGMHDQIGLVRFNSDGLLDNSFGSEGKVTTQPEPDSADILQDAILLQNGKIMVLGTSREQGSSDILLVRFNPDGTPDNRYGRLGKKRINIGLSNDSANTALVQADGKIVIAGSSSNAQYSNSSQQSVGSVFALARYLTDGTRDRSFNGNGKVLTPFLQEASIHSLLQQDDGKLLAVGETHDVYKTPALVRYNSDGTVDTTFGNQGIVIVPATNTHVAIQAAVLQTDGKVVAAGYTNGKNLDVLLLRFNADGTLDSTFGKQGQALTDIDGYSVDQAAAIIQQSDGKLVVVSNCNNGSSDDIVLTRYNTDGSLDTGFHATGKNSIDVEDHSVDTANALVQQADGKFLVIGTSDDAMLVLRFNPDASLDTTFNSTGKLTLRIGTNSSDQGRAVLQQADGKLLLLGVSKKRAWGDKPEGHWQAALMRLNSDGSLDTTFHGKGKITQAVGNSDMQANALLRTTSGELFIAGYTTAVSADSEFVLLKMHTD